MYIIKDKRSIKEYNPKNDLKRIKRLASLRSILSNSKKNTLNYKKTYLKAFLKRYVFSLRLNSDILSQARM